MATYIIISLPFIISAVFLALAVRLKLSKGWLVALIVMFTLTFVFDSLIIWADIVNYDSSKILGLYFGKAPVEDYLYTVFAMLIVPSLWHLFGRAGNKNDS